MTGASQWGAGAETVEVLGGVGADEGAHAEFIVGLLPPAEGLALYLGWLGPS